MFNPKLYHELCRELRAPEEKIEEIIAMTEQNKKRSRRPFRAVLVAAAALAVMAVGVSAANPEAVQELIYQFTYSIRVGDFRQDLTTEDGDHVTVFTMPEVTVENKDGRTILAVDGEETDITDALNEDGRYDYQRVDEGTELKVTVEGSPEQWIMTAGVGAPGEEFQFSFTADSQGKESGPVLPDANLSAEGEKRGSVTVTTYDGENFSEVQTEK